MSKRAIGIDMLSASTTGSRTQDARTRFTVAIFLPSDPKMELAARSFRLKFKTLRSGVVILDLSDDHVH
jgi:hypothetical protein